MNPIGCRSVNFPRLSWIQPLGYPPFTTYHRSSNGVVSLPHVQFIQLNGYVTREMDADARVTGGRPRVVCVIDHVQGRSRTCKCTPGKRRETEHSYNFFR